MLADPTRTGESEDSLSAFGVCERVVRDVRVLRFDKGPHVGRKELDLRIRWAEGNVLQDCIDSY